MARQNRNKLRTGLDPGNGNSFDGVLDPPKQACPNLFVGCRAISRPRLVRGFLLIRIRLQILVEPNSLKASSR